MPPADSVPPDSSSSSPGLSLLRFSVRVLRVSASTLAVVALLQQRWLAGSAFALVWLLILAAPRLLPLLREEGDPSTHSSQAQGASGETGSGEPGA